MPITVVQGTVSALMRTHLPIASSFGQSFFTIDSLADHDARRVLAVGRVERAAAKNPRPHGREEIRRAGLQREAAQPGHRVDAGHVQRKVPRRPERNGERQRRVLDAGERLRLGEQRVPQRDVLERIARHPARVRADVQQPVGVVPHSHVLDVGQAAQEEARADQQHDRERRLRDQAARRGDATDVRRPLARRP